jgi:hypothetical protein
VSILLAVDPGLRYPAAALFVDGVLKIASRVKVPATYHKMERGQRCLEVAKLIETWARKACVMSAEPLTMKPDELVIEWPRTYNRMKGDPADLFPLAGVGMAIAGMLMVSVSAPTAPEWIGNIPKSTTGDPLSSMRGARIWSRLSDAEQAVVVVSHDSIDAVGIGLWKLNRLERRQSFIGASQ